MEKKTSSSLDSLKNPHFFQPLLPGFNNHIKIPETFFSKYIEGKHEEKTVNLILDISKKTWKVKMEGNKLTEGWKEFVEAHDLRMGDVVVFRHEGDMLFNVTVLGPSGCEIQYTQPPSHEESEDNDSEISSESDKEVETEPDQVSSDLNCFSQTVTASNLSRDEVTVDKEFGRRNGFLNKKKHEILLMNQEGKTWESKVKTYQDCRVKIVRGWRNFCTANKLKVEDSCRFRLVRDRDTVAFQLCSPEKNQFVKLTLTLSSLNLGKQHLPVSFTRENGLTNPGKIVMVDKNRTEWLMNLSVDRRNTMYIMNGNAWKRFCAANEASAGESLTLELVRGGRCPVLKFVSKMERSPSEAEGRPHKRARVGRLNHDVGEKIFEGEPSTPKSTSDQGNLQTQILSILDDLATEEKRVEDILTSITRIKAKLVSKKEKLEALLLEI